MTPKKRYVRDFSLSMFLYVSSLWGITLFLKHNDISLWFAILLVLIPVVPILWALRAVLVISRTWDELQKQQALESVLIAFLVVAFGTFSYGLLEGVGLPKLDTVWILPLLIFTQGLAQVYVVRKYR